LKVVVTGATGFLGPYVVQELESRGHDVAGLSSRDGDLAADGIAERLLETHSPEAVVHLAAVVGRLVGDEDPARTIRTNVGGAALVARACAARGTRLAFGSTTDAETPANLYAWTKRWSEEAVALFTDALVLRIGMPYGAGKGAVANILAQARARQRIPVHRDEVRSWCWAGDVASGIAVALESGRTGTLNVARADDPRTMRDVAELACAIVGAPADLIDEIDPPPSSAPQLADAPELRKLGWTPTVSLEDGMRSMAAA
jgi:nucleoside-diphosphate-sugar epimerase